MKRDKTFRLHAEVFKETIKNIMEQEGVDRVNLWGVSMGGGVAEQMAQDPEFQRILEDLTVIEGVGFEQKSMAKMGLDFGVMQGALRTLPDAEARLKTLDQGRATSARKKGLFAADARLLARKQFDEEALAEVNPQGEYKVVVAGDSPVQNSRKVERMLFAAEELRLKRNPNASPLQFYRVEGADHGFPLVHAMGLTEFLDQERPDERVTTVRKEDLAHSVVESVLKSMERKSV